MQSGTTDKPKLPHWELDSIYPGFDSNEYSGHWDAYFQAVSELEKSIADSKLRKQKPAKWLLSCIEGINTTSDLIGNLESYIYCRYTTNTQSKEALREMNKLEEAVLPLKRASVSFRNALAKISKEVTKLIDKKEEISRYAFYLKEELTLQKKQMSPEEEDLAADLSRAGSDAWSRLQDSITSTLTAVWEESSGETKTLVQLRALAYHAERSVREKAYTKELSLLRNAEIPLAYSLNGVKGFTGILNKRRKWKSTLDKSTLQSRISEKTLNSLVQVAEEFLPMFRRYLTAKAKHLGIDRCAFYDLFAPLGTSSKEWSFDEARDFIVSQFGTFSKDLAGFADHAFRKGWIDAEPRKGKVGGAYCTSMPLAGESRVLCNFDGSFSALTTVAHELGHGYHHHVLKDAPAIHRDYPMTLAETASTFCETIVFEKALEAAGEEDRLAILEADLQDSCQIVVDILSRFKFESQVMEKRSEAELGPDDFCDLMLKAQKDTYGDGLDPEKLHPYMWAVKPHYYRAELAFYNFPYTFGQLFGLGLYSKYREEGTDFPEKYRSILDLTGKASAVDVTAEAGFKIEKPEFWRSGMKLIEEKIKQFESLIP